MTDVVWPKTANEQLKDRFDSVLSGSLIVAVVGHALLFQFFPEMTAEKVGLAAIPLTRLETLADIPIPVAPAPLARPAKPVVSDDIPVEATIPVIGFREAAEFPPPPPDTERTTGGQASRAFAVFTVAPVLLDPEGFQRALLRAYPQSLRDAGIGGTVELLVQIDEDGRVLGATLGKSSGYERLDQVALSLADRMRFRPALNRDMRVAVLVSIPVAFRVN